MKWIASTTKQVVMDGLVATLSSISGHILALGQEASGRLSDLVSTLGLVSGFILALGQKAPGCIRLFQHIVTGRVKLSLAVAQH